MEPTPRPAVSRTPGQDDLVRLCGELNAHGVRYVVVGGFAVAVCVASLLAVLGLLVVLLRRHKNSTESAHISW